MFTPHASLAESPEPASPLLEGWLLWFVRSCWLALAGFMLALALAGVQAIYLSGPVPPELHLIGISEVGYRTYRLALDLLCVFIFFGVAGVLFWRKSDDVMALFVAATLVVFAAAWVGDPALMGGWAQPHKLSAWLARSCMLNLALLFPTGRFVPRWTIVPGLAWPVVWAVTLAFPPPQPARLALDLAMLGFMVYAQTYRYRRSGAAARQHIKWLVFSYALSFFIAFVIELLPFALPELRAGHALAGYTMVHTLVSDLLFTLIPLCIGLSLLRRRLWGIDPVINRTLLYTALSACVVAIYALTVGLLGLVLQPGLGTLSSLLAASAVAVLIQPLRERFQQRLNRLMYGERDAPFEVLARLGRRLEGALAPEAILQTIAETVAQALKLPYAAVVLNKGEIVAEAGSPGAAGTVGQPLVYGLEQIGELVVSPRAVGEAFGETEQHLLKTVANQASVAVHALKLTADLQRSREQLVVAREEERLRIRRDLHDGLGPSLASMTLGLDEVGYLLEHDPAAVSDQLEELKKGTRVAIADIRRLVYALRPPALDELGLVAALRQRALTYRQAGTEVAIEVPRTLPPLTAAAEVAAYRIVEEALTNVVRHAKASSCRVVLTWQNGTLEIEISDNGVGLPLRLDPGIGLNSMRERAEELGGSFSATRIPAGGTRLRVTLPAKGRA